MRHVSMVILAAGLVAAACSKSKDEQQAGEQTGAAAQEAKPQTPPPKPYDGPLTAERLQQAKDSVKPFQKWDEAYPRLLATVGQATEVDGASFKWYLLVGDKCHELSVENNNGEVGAVGLGEYDKMMKSKFEKCQSTGAGGEAEGGAAADQADQAEQGGGQGAGEAAPAATPPKVEKKAAPAPKVEKKPTKSAGEGGW